MTEGMPSIMVYERLMAQPYLTGAIPVPAEGSVLPDSYEIQRGQSREAVIRRMREAHDELPHAGLAEVLAQAEAGQKPAGGARILACDQINAAQNGTCPIRQVGEIPNRCRDNVEMPRLRRERIIFRHQNAGRKPVPIADFGSRIAD